jgi:hypothetical protein
MLMSFVLVLLLSVVSMTQVEVQVANISQRQKEAQQNALLGLNVAMAQLQRFAGPDQRVTAPADLLADLDRQGDATVAPSGLTLASGTRYWTGVWGNGESDIGYDLSPSAISGSGTEPVLLNWLVSGNEGVDYSLLGNEGAVTAGTDTAAPTFILGKGSSGFSGSNYTVNNKDGSSQVAALLVGPNSTSAESDYVLAPMVTIDASSSSSGQGGGAYAWWVGDEGVKARVNLQNGYQETGDSDDTIYSFLTSQRSAPEEMDSDDNGSLINTKFDFTSSKVPVVTDLAELPFIASSTSDQTSLEQAVSFRFHDMTTTSMGVLSDAYAGGLKKDLTADIADTSSTYSYRPQNSDPLFTPLSTSEANLPTWGHLRSWARRQADTTGEVTPVPVSDTEAGFGPMLLYASLGLDAYVEQIPADISAGTPKRFEIKVAFYPVVVLSNPYPVAIAAKDYDIGFRISPPESGGTSRESGPMIQFDTGPDDNNFTTVAALDLGTPAMISGDTASGDSNWIGFRIQGSVLPPGESHIYRLSVDGDTYEPGDFPILTVAPSVSVGNPIGLTNALILNTSYILPDSYTGTELMRAMTRNISTGYLNKLEVELVDPGELGNGTGVYQSAEMFMSDRRIGTQYYRLFQTDAVDVTTLEDWPTVSAGARSALQVSPRLEGRGDYSDAGRFGMPFIPSYWLRNNNSRAPYIVATELETNATYSPNSLNRVGTTVMGGVLANAVGTRDVALYPNNYGHLINAGGVIDITSSYNLHYATLFDVLDSPDYLISLGQLQNAPLARYSIYPTYPFANSYADPRIERTETYRNNIVPRPGSITLDPAYDLSWHLNRSLWDRYFVSSVSSTMTSVTEPLPNSRIELYAPDDSLPALSSIKASSGQHDAYDQAAAQLMVNGAFNINSTSEQAWRAVLGGALGLTSDADFAVSGDQVESIIPFPRISHGLSRSANSPFNDTLITMQVDATDGNTIRDTLYHGNRGLDLGYSNSSDASAIVAELARTIVTEIRRNGPFLSLADFINRPILSSKQDAGIKGVLQTAIDTMEPSAAQVNPYSVFNEAVGIPGYTDVSSSFTSWDSEHYYGGPLSEEGSGRETFASSSNMAPKFLTQADLLSTLGPALSARSDTFRIRAYGQSENSLTGDADGQAWCEAIVQRLPDYVDDSQDAWEDATGDNQTFGRRFKIVSFRWLSPSEI